MEVTTPAAMPLVNTVLTGHVLDRLREIPDNSVHCCVTSPPYWGLRDYGVEGQLGLEKTPQEFIANMTAVFEEVRRVLRPDGTCWVNIGDSYYNTSPGSGGKCVLPGAGKAMTEGRYHDAKRDFSGTGLKPKDLCLIPFRLAIALQEAGWYVRSDIIWSKPNPMPESVRDRPTKAHEYLFLLTKSAKYFYDADAIAEPATRADTSPQSPARLNSGAPMVARVRDDFDGTRNARTVWTIATQAYPVAHFATFPEELPRRCILAGCPEGGTVLDPFGGSGTTGAVAKALGRDFILIELNPEYVKLIEKRLDGVTPGFRFAEAS